VNNTVTVQAGLWTIEVLHRGRSQMQKDERVRKLVGVRSPDGLDGWTPSASARGRREVYESVSVFVAWFRR